MPKGNADYLKFDGDWNAYCDRCGFKFKASQLREEWQGWMVCKECYEPRHPQELLRTEAEDTSVEWTRSSDPEQGGTDVSGNTIQITAYNTDVLTDVPDGTNDGGL